MKIFVKAKPGAKEDRVIPPPLKLMPDEREYYVVSTKERPVQGQANKAITKLLAEHFNIPRSQIRLVAGNTSKNKVFDISTRN